MNYEIEELEQRIVELEGQNAFECGCVSEYKEKLDIAVRALKFYAYPKWWMQNPMGGCAMDEQTYRPAQQALEEIGEL